MSGIPAKCETLEFVSGLPCGRTATWLVRVGTRTADGQCCCGNHLNMTCSAMYEAEDRRGASLTVTEVTP
jgi:hypothetical protein